jgi:hypothetical protein
MLGWIVALGAFYFLFRLTAPEPGKAGTPAQRPEEPPNGFLPAPPAPPAPEKSDMAGESERPPNPFYGEASGERTEGGFPGSFDDIIEDEPVEDVDEEELEDAE